MLKKRVSKTYFYSLLAIAKADDIIRDSEIDFYLEKARFMGFSEDEAWEMIKNYDGQAIDQMDIDNVQDKFEFLADMVFMSIVDGELHEKEYDACVAIAKRFGIETSYIDEITDRFK